jgi:hypothetical protein
VRVLALVALADGPVSLCANDRVLAGRLKLTLAELRHEAAAGAAGAAA